MKIDIKDIRSNLTIIDKDNNTFEKGEDIININIPYLDNHYRFAKAIYVIAKIINLNDIETVIYQYIIERIIKIDNDMKDSTVITLNTIDIKELSEICNKSITHIYRNIASLVSKDILRYYKDSKGIPIDTKYVINPQYDVSKYFTKNTPNVILINL